MNKAIETIKKHAWLAVLVLAIIVIAVILIAANFNSPVVQTDTDVILIEVESETDTEIEAETEPETEDPVLAAARREARLENLAGNLLLMQRGEDFRIPMSISKDTAALEMPGASCYGSGFLFFDRSALPMEYLEDRLTTQLESYDGSWSVYVKNLSTDESFVINDRGMKSASVMKLFIMGTVYTAIDNGELSRTDEIVSLLNSMISYSSNEASNQLLYILGNSSYADGIAKVNTFIEEHGFSEMTVEYNGFEDSATYVGDGINQVAAKDVGKLLEDIYRRTWMSRSDSNEMESMLLAQNTRYKIPAGLPDGVLCANKTGEMSTTENDAAIIYSDHCDYILVVLSSDWGDDRQAIDRIANISSVVYQFFN